MTEAAKVWHYSLPIQIGWTYKISGCHAGIYCPGNAFPWLLGAINGPDSAQTLAYARLISAAPELYSALDRLKSDCALIVAGKPCRNHDETLAEVNAAIDKATKG